jgi:hypothetical protein
MNTSILSQAILYKDPDASFFLNWKVKHSEFPFSLGDVIYSRKFSRKTSKAKQKTRAWTISGGRPSSTQIIGEEQKIMILIKCKKTGERQWIAPSLLVKMVNE